MKNFENITYQTVCWSIGTTSFRVKEVHYKTAYLLTLLNEFYKEYKEWTPETQTKYYRMLQVHGLAVGEANRPDKDARQKTSALVDLGLVNNERKITAAGEELLKLIDEERLKVENDLNINTEYTYETLFLNPISFFYLKQFLKLSLDYKGNTYKEFTVKPFIAFIYCIVKLTYITKEEFNLLIPLIKTPDDAIKMVKSIEKIRNGEKNFHQVILGKLEETENFNLAKRLFLSKTQNIDLDVFNKVAMNRKSSKYVIPYHELYLLLERTFINKQPLVYDQVEKSVNKISVGPRSHWKTLVFGDVNKVSNKKVKFQKFKELVSTFSDLNALKNWYFSTLHLIKTLCTLSDYADLNMRYFKLADIASFSGNQIVLDPKVLAFFEECIDALIYSKSTLVELQNVTKSLGNIHLSLNVDSKKVFKNIRQTYNLPEDISPKRVTEYIVEDKIRRFNEFVDNKFSKKNLIDILENINLRQDAKVQKLVTDVADVPTIFEYITGIIIYKMTNKVIDVLSAFKLSIDADFLPVRHAPGLTADMIIPFERNEQYPKHDLILEMTLMSSSNQKRAEIEPVIRHLSTHRNKIGKDKETYALFIAGELDMNVIQQFRIQKNIPYFVGENVIENNKISAMKIEHLKVALEKDMTYSDLYKIIKNSIDADLSLHPNEWLENYIQQPINKFN